jgi:hypothetical protein
MPALKLRISIPISHFYTVHLIQVHDVATSARAGVLKVLVLTAYSLLTRAAVKTSVACQALGKLGYDAESREFSSRVESGAAKDADAWLAF